MNNKNEFLDLLRSGLEAPIDFTRPLQVLQQVSEAIGKNLSPGLVCLLEPGFTTNLGQEWRLVIESPPHWTHIVLRAHVPINGYPVQLDLYEEELIRCIDEAALRLELENFIKRPEIIEMIRYFSSKSALAG